eukprot:scaffold142046_cov15-Prasinocladus_malaysianus.AAC.1
MQVRTRTGTKADCAVAAAILAVNCRQHLPRRRISALRAFVQHESSSSQIWTMLNLAYIRNCCKALGPRPLAQPRRRAGISYH